MKKNRLTVFFLVLSITVHAQYRVETDPQTGKKGYVDQIDGSVVIPFEYDEVDVGWQTSVMGYAAVGKNGLWGLYKLEGELVLPIRYEYVRAIHADLLAARAPENDTLLHFFNGKGEALFQTAGQTAEPGFNENTVQVIRPDMSRVFLDLKGQDPFQGRFVNGRWTDGKTVVCATIDNRGNLSQAGLFSWEGDTLLPPVYFNIQAHPGGRFLVQTTDYQMGMIDEQGRFLIPLGPVRLSKMGNQPQDVILALEGSPLNGKVYDPNGRLLMDSCVTDNVAFKGGIGKFANQHFYRYFTASNAAKYSTGLFHLDGRPILPMQYKEIQYASDDHPLIVHDGAAYLIMGWDGKPAYPGRFKRLEYTADPGLLYGQPENGDRGGFIHIGDPAGDRFTLQKIILLPHSGYFAVKEEGAYYLHDAAGRRVNNQGYAFLEQPERKHYTAWREKMKSGRLVAYGASAQRGDDQPWVGFDEKGKAHDFPPLQPKEEVVAMEEVVVIESPRQEEEICDFPDKPAEYPGGESERLKFMVSQLNYPALAKENAIQGMVVVKFVVEKDGSITNIQIVRDIGGGCGKEVVRIIGLMPKWKPGMKNGFPVRSWQTFPFRFKLE
ncbi:MAG: TonB family protein [Saprospirales bacterium]|nr:TonB family protein [Saprospirales bacterium]